MAERINYTPIEFNDDSDRFEGDLLITSDDYRISGIKIDDEVPATENVSHLHDNDEVRFKTQDGREIYIDHDNSEMYRAHERAKQNYKNETISLAEATGEKEKRYLRKSTLVTNVKGDRFRKGFTSEECIVKRVLTEDDKWPTIDGLNKYMAISEVKFTYHSQGRTGSLSFKPGEMFMAPKKCEDNEKRNEILKKASGK